MTTVLVSGGFTLLGVLGAALFAFRGQRGETKVSEITQILDGYRDIVTSLQAEIRRLEERIEVMSQEQEECDRRNRTMQQELDSLKFTVAEMRAEGYQ